MSLLSLPRDIQENIFSYVSYHDIAKYRLVSKSFDELSKYLLNRGLMKVQKRRAKAIENIKARMAITSYEGQHPLTPHLDILVGLEARIDRIHEIYFMYIDLNMCCFIPGLVLDEIMSVIYVVETSENLPPVTELLRNVIYLSTLAIKHFTKRIIPKLKRPSNQGPVVFFKLMHQLTKMSRQVDIHQNFLTKMNIPGEITGQYHRELPTSRRRMIDIKYVRKIYKRHDIYLNRLVSLTKATKALAREFTTEICNLNPEERPAAEDEPVAGPSTSSEAPGPSFHHEPMDADSSDDD